MQTITYLKDLLKHELKDLYSAETQLLESLPKMVAKANNASLKKKLSQHLAVTKQHKERLDKIQQILDKEHSDNEPEEDKGFFANLFKRKEGKEHCRAMEGLIKEGKKIMKTEMPVEVMDAAIIAAAQKIEHYEISSYGTAKAFALQIGMKEIAAILDTTLQEEHTADAVLNELALTAINETAEEANHVTTTDAKNTNTQRKDSSKDAATKKVAVKKAAKKTAPKTVAAKKKSNKPLATKAKA
jgi:ferritin-like metal-binding protein YciE